MAKFWSSKRNRVLVVALGALLLVAASFFGIYLSNVSRVLPGTSVGTLDVSGMNRGQLESALQQASEKTLTVIVSDTNVEATPQETGVSIDIQSTADEVFSPNTSIFQLLGGMFGSRVVDPIVDVDEVTVDSFASTLPIADADIAADASISFDGNRFVASESKVGRAIDADSLKTALEESASTLWDSPVKAMTADQQPRITTDIAETAAAAANNWIAPEVVVDDGEGTSGSPDVATKATWVTFDKETLTPSLDREAIKKWVDEFGDQTDIDPVPGYRNVDENGQVVATVHGPESGWVVSNADAITDAITQGLSNGNPVYATFDYVEQEGKWEDRPADPATKDLVYRAAADEKWIDLNLTTNTVTAYEGAKVVGGPFYMVPGAPETPTITGEFNIYLKYDVQTMRGENADGTPYVTEDVPWVSYFSGGYGFHGAPWRSSFGWSGPGGSHGCINMPVDEAKFIYDWADMGTKVISRY